jgi:hypothetical protein
MYLDLVDLTNWLVEHYDVIWTKKKINKEIFPFFSKQLLIHVKYQMNLSLYKRKVYYGSTWCIIETNRSIIETASHVRFNIGLYLIPAVPWILNWVYPVTFGSLSCRNEAMKASSTSCLLIFRSLMEKPWKIWPTMGVTMADPGRMQFYIKILSKIV